MRPLVVSHLASGGQIQRGAIAKVDERRGRVQVEFARFEQCAQIMKRSLAGPSLPSRPFQQVCPR